jgi:hypothetical protein
VSRITKGIEAQHSACIVKSAAQRRPDKLASTTSFRVSTLVVGVVTDDYNLAAARRLAASFGRACVFRPRAVDEIGRKLYPSNWTGQEYAAELIGALPLVRPHHQWGGAAHIAHQLLVRHRPD